MSDVNPQVFQQALVAVLSAAQEKGVDVGGLVDRAREILTEPGNKAKFIPDRDVEHVDLELELARNTVKGL